MHQPFTNHQWPQFERDGDLMFGKLLDLRRSRHDEFNVAGGLQ